MKIRLYGVIHTGSRAQFEHVLREMEQMPQASPQLQLIREANKAALRRELARRRVSPLAITWTGIFLGWAVVLALVDGMLLQVVLLTAWYLACVGAYRLISRG